MVIIINLKNIVFDGFEQVEFGSEEALEHMQGTRQD